MYESAPEPEAVAVAELGFDALSDAMVFKIPPNHTNSKTRRERERERERESRV